METVITLAVEVDGPDEAVDVYLKVLQLCAQAGIELRRQNHHEQRDSDE